MSLLRLFAVVLSFFMLSACVTRTIEKETVVERPRVQAVPGPQGPPGPPGPQGATGPTGDTTIVIPAR
jgi:hypothetical protein